MDIHNQIMEILRSLGRIEGRLSVFSDLSERLSKLEMRQSWLKGVWAALAVVFAYVCREALRK